MYLGVPCVLIANISASCSSFPVSWWNIASTERGESLSSEDENFIMDDFCFMCASSCSSTACISFLLSMSSMPTDMNIADLKLLKENATGFALSIMYIFGILIFMSLEYFRTNETSSLFLDWRLLENM